MALERFEQLKSKHETIEKGLSSSASDRSSAERELSALTSKLTDVTEKYEKLRERYTKESTSMKQLHYENATMKAELEMNNLKLAG